VTLRSVVFDCPDPPALASFYSRLLDGQSDTSDPEWCVVRLGESMPRLAFQLVREYEPPVWPNGAAQQLHLDLTVADVHTASRRAVGLGARVLSDPIEEPGCLYVVHADPAQHPFCLCQTR